MNPMRRIVALATLFVVSALSGAASAGFTESTVAAVHAVSWEPSKDAPARFRIDGVFSLLDWTSGALAWGEPLTGTMYFECPAGHEATCASHWSSIEARIHAGEPCVAFGRFDQPHGSVRALEEPLSDPDPWEIQSGLDAALGGHECSELLAIEKQAFHAPSDDAGAPLPDAGADAAAPDAGSSPAETTADESARGCSVSPGSRSSGGLVALAALLFGAVIAGARRRRRSARARAVVRIALAGAAVEPERSARGMRCES
jgi:MYXO-CTERM domain-containing protein